MCVNEDGCCRSVNYKKNSLYDEKENCELLHVTPVDEPGLIEVHPDYDHYVLLEPNRVSEGYKYIVLPAQGFMTPWRRPQYACVAEKVTVIVSKYISSFYYCSQ
jgi:hypothetical protein